MGPNGAFPRDLAQVIDDINNLTSNVVDPFPDALYSTHFGYHVPFTPDPFDEPIIQQDLEFRSDADFLMGELPDMVDLPPFDAIADLWEAPVRSETELAPGSDPISKPLPDLLPKPKFNPIFGSTSFMGAREVESEWGSKRMRTMERARGSAWFGVKLLQRQTEGLEERPSWLPPGWKISCKRRMNGASAGMVDKYYTEPITHKRFRSKKAVMHHLEVSDKEGDAGDS